MNIITLISKRKRVSWVIKVRDNNEMTITNFRNGNYVGESIVSKFPDANTAKLEAFSFIISKLREGFKLETIDPKLVYKNFILHRIRRSVYSKENWSIRFRDELEQAYLTFHSADNKEFWHIRTHKDRYTIVAGEIGKKSTSTTKIFKKKNATEIVKEVRTLIEAKEKAGYTKLFFIKTQNIFAGKLIEDFDRQSLYPNSAVKLSAPLGCGMRMPEQLELLTKFPNFAFLDTLVIGSRMNYSPMALEVSLEKMISLKSNFSGLKHLFIGDISMITQTNYSGFYQHFPQLESFGVRGSRNLTLGKIQLPKLKHLIIEAAKLQKEMIRDVCSSTLPDLEHIDIWLGSRANGGSIEPADLMPILNGKFPKLKYLGLKNYDQQDDLMKILKGTTVLRHLEVLDISMSVLTDEGAKALFHNNDLLRLKHINCRHHYISEEWREKLKTKFANQNIDLRNPQTSKEINGKSYFDVKVS